MYCINATQMEAIRAQSKLSQEQFANGAGILQSYISRVETDVGHLSEKAEQKVPDV